MSLERLLRSFMMVKKKLKRRLIKLTWDEVDEIVEHVLKGETYAKVAKAYKISKAVNFG